MGEHHLAHILPSLRAHAQRGEPFIALVSYPDDRERIQQGMGGVFATPLARALAQRALMLYGFDDTTGAPPIAEALSGAGADGPWLAFAFFPLCADEREAMALMDVAGLSGDVEPLEEGGVLCPPVVLAYALSEPQVRQRLWDLARQPEVTETWVDYGGELCADNTLSQPPWFRARLRRALMAAEAECT